MSQVISTANRAARARPVGAALLLMAAIPLPTAPAAPSSPPAGAEAGLVYRWRFDKAHLRGTGFSPVAGKLPAKVVGPLRLAADTPESLLLDGNSKAGHRVEITDDLAAAALPARQITVEAWAMLDAAPKWGAFIGAFQDNGNYERGWLLGHTGASFCFAIATEAGKSLTYLPAPAPLQTGYWYHVAGTYDGTVQALYVDGRPVARSIDQQGDIAYPPKAFLTIGAYRDDNELYTMAGRVEQVSIYSRALPAGEVRTLYEARKGRFADVEPPPPPPDDDWPTYRHDAQRSGVAGRPLALPLHLAWVHRARHAPAPAWPAPARHDLWHYRYNLQPRVIYDRAFHVTAAADRIYFGSSSEDKVTCLDAATGRALWSFFAEGPVRLAPAVAGGRVLFGSDDGLVYCLAADDGRLLWKHRAGPADRRIIGNGRLISAFPVRTDALVADGAAHFCAGLFPLQGVYQAHLAMETGRPLAVQRIAASPQGYQQYEHGRLLAPTGEDRRGALLSPQKRRGKVTPAPLPMPELPYACISAGRIAFGGGDGKVAAVNAADGVEVWSARVEGRAYGLAAARGRLLVSTDAGAIHCFTPQATESGAAALIEPPAAAEVPCDDAAQARRCSEAAERIVRETGVQRGYCLILGPSPARLAAELARRTEMRIVVWEPDGGKADAARRALDAAGLYGTRVAVHHGGPGKLPYADYLFNVVVAGQAVLGGRFEGERAEVLRVLVPGRGFAFLDGGPGGPVRREALAGGGEWTALWGDAGNTACSGDRLVAGPLAVQWFGEPGPRDMVDRHHRDPSPLCKDGRLFVPGDEVIFALDAYNGTSLWRADMPGTRRLGVFLDCGPMALDERLLYVIRGRECLGLDVRTGRRATAYQVPPQADGNSHRWGYLALAGDLLIGSASKKASAYTEISREADDALWYDNMSLVTSDTLFALDRAAGRMRWHYGPAGPGVILNTTLAVGDGRVYFLESRSPAAAGDNLGRMPMAAFSAGECALVALEAATGRPAWRRGLNMAGFQLIAYLSCARGMLVLSGCRYVDKTLWYAVCGIDAATGQAKWRQEHDTGFKPRGDHGEQNRHPTIVGETVYLFPLAYDLRTGRQVEGWRFSRQGNGCGNLSASADCLFWRGTNPWVRDLRPGGGPARINAVSRPGCFINIIPAGGMVLIPEASSGCTCDYPLQTSFGYAPDGPSTSAPAAGAPSASPRGGPPR